jgi:phage tail tape-measure protein
MDNNILPNNRYTKAHVFDQLCEEYKDLKKWLSQKKFNSWLKKYADFKSYDFTEGNSNGARWFELIYATEEQITTNEPYDIWDELDKKAGF